MKVRTIIQIVLAVVIVGLAYLVYNSIQKPMRFADEYTHRRDACAEKLKSIRTLEEAYKLTYGTYTGSFDTLINRLMTEDSMKVVSKQIMPIIDAATGKKRQLTDEEIKNLRYVPYPKGEKNEFELQAGQLEKSGFMVSVFECKVPLEVLLKDLDNQLVVNKIAEIHEVKDRYAGWKVGDMTQAVTDGNFE